MGHSEKFLVGRNNAETKELLEILYKYGKAGNLYDIVGIETFKMNKILRYRDIIGIGAGDLCTKFTFTTIFEIENKEKFYRKPSELGMMLDNAIDEDSSQLKIGPAYGEEKEWFVNKGTKMVWISGDRGNINDVYRLLNLDIIATQVLLEMFNDGVLDDEYITEGKIDIEKALPVVERIIATKELSEHEIEILENAKVIDLDGIPNVDAMIQNPELLSFKKYRR